MSTGKLVLSMVGWVSMAVLLGAAIGYSAHASPVFCSRMIYFCGLPPSGYGFWSVGISGMLLLHGCVDLLRALLRDLFAGEVQHFDRVRWRLAGMQVLLGGSLLMTLLLSGFLGAAQVR